MLIVIRIGSQLPTPGVNGEYIKNFFAQNTGEAFNLFNAFTGGSFEQMSVFALSITPYITSSIIVQLLTIAIPQLEEMQRDGETGRKKLVATEDAHLNAALRSVLSTDSFCGEPNLKGVSEKAVLNPVKEGFDTYFTPYLDGNINQPIPQFATAADGYAHGILMLDPEYNNANKGPMMVERVGFSMKAVKTDEPEGIKYLAKQAFDFFCPSWRGVAYIYIGNPADVYHAENAATAWANPATFIEVKPTVFTKAVSVVGTVNTAAQG